MMRPHALLLGILLPALLAACGGEEKPDPPPPQETTPPKPEAPAEETPVSPAQEPAPQAEPDPAEKVETAEITAPVRVIDLAGKPLSAMAPIACTKPNAFTQPLRTGPLTNEQGRSEVTFPGDRKLYLRAWDPDTRYFSNNFQTYLGTGAEVRDIVELVMVEGARLTAILASPDRQPLAEQEVRLMMAHPTQGPWWPARTTTDTGGVADFGTVPAGRFLLEIRSQAGYGRQIPETGLLPGRDVDLGLVVLNAK